jgi:hypothetical protein
MMAGSPIAALEIITQGLALATSHRVVSPPMGSPDRYSIPFFQCISQRLRLGEMGLDSLCLVKDLHNFVIALTSLGTVSESILGLKHTRGDQGKVECAPLIHYQPRPGRSGVDLETVFLS